LEPQDLWAELTYNYNGLARFSQCCNQAHLAAGSPAATSIAIIGSDKPDLNDIATFFKTFNIPWDVTLHETGSPACCDDEMTADTEWSGASVNSAPSTGTGKVMIYAGDGGFSGLLNAWEAALSDNKTRVASSSYADAEPDFGGSAAPSISDFIDVTRSMTAMGWTLVASSGDEGDAECMHGSVYYPATDPNVVAVGGTALNLFYGPFGYNKETAWSGNGCANPDKPTNNGGGGGGCSDTFSATSWNPKCCTNGRRSIPDLSLNGGGILQALYYSYANCVYTYPGATKSIKNICGRNGTSIAAPEVAGFFAQENAYLLTLGNNCGPSHDAPCAPLGRAGPFLFAAPKQSHDPSTTSRPGPPQTASARASRPFRAMIAPRGSAR
jgi:subtilase family serine protease